MRKLLWLWVVGLLRPESGRSGRTRHRALGKLRLSLALVLVCVGIALGLPPDEGQEPEARDRAAVGAVADKPLRVLMIGNSFTSFHQMPKTLDGLGRAKSGAPRLIVETATVGGATLQRHWEEGKAAARIREGGWDFVVLQEQSRRPVDETDLMYRFAVLLDQEVRKMGARTVLYLTWRWQDHTYEQRCLDDAYFGLGLRLGAKVAPVGPAWQRAREADPDMVLYSQDRYHPSPAGSYLAACVLYAALTGEEPSDEPTAGVPAEAARLLRRVAWETLQAGDKVWSKPRWMSCAPALALRAQPVHGAAIAGDTKRLGAILDGEPGMLHARDGRGLTPLHLASRLGHEAAVALLLERGANAGARSKDGRTPLQMIGPKIDANVTRRLLGAGADPNNRGRDGWTALAAAARHGHVESVSLLLDAGAEAVGPPSDPSLLRWAARMGQPEVARMLIRRGHEPDVFAAAGIADLPSLQEMLDADPRLVEARTAMGLTPLHFAAKAAATAPTGFLLDRGAKIDAPDEHGRSALALAVDCPDVVRLLLARGANPDVARADTLRPVRMAAWRTPPDSYFVLAEHGAKVDLGSACLAGDMKRIEALLREDPDCARKTDGHGLTPLHHAASRGRPKIIRLLLAKGAEPDARDGLRRTALNLLTTKAPLDAYKALLDAGAPVNAADSYQGWTALHLAAALGRADVVELLLERGADPALRDRRGRTPADLARNAKKEELADRLLAAQSRQGAE